MVRLRVAGTKGKEILRLRSLELTPVGARAAIEADKQRARAHRANTDWFARAGYGLWFHFLDLTTPPSGPRKPYERSEEHTSELQSLMRISYAVFCLKKKKHNTQKVTPQTSK